jgi:hypothetical protein
MQVETTPLDTFGTARVVIWSGLMLQVLSVPSPLWMRSSGAQISYMLSI